MNPARKHTRAIIALAMLSFLSINLSAQPPIITRFEFGLPTTATPIYTLYEFTPFPPRWFTHYPQGSNVCKDVTISFTTEVNKRYWVETGGLQQKLWWEPPSTTFYSWRQCSDVIGGTGGVVSWHGGGAYDWSLYRIRRE